MRQWTERSLADLIDVETDIVAEKKWQDKVEKDVRKIYDYALNRPSKIPASIDMLLAIGTDNAARRIGLLAARNPAHVPKAIQALQSIGSEVAARYIGHIAVHRPHNYSVVDIAKFHLNHSLPNGDEHLERALLALSAIDNDAAREGIDELGQRDSGLVIGLFAGREEPSLCFAVTKARRQQAIHKMAIAAGETGAMPPEDARALARNNDPTAKEIVGLARISDIAGKLECIEILKEKGGWPAVEGIGSLAKSDEDCLPAAVKALEVLREKGAYGAMDILLQVAQSYSDRPRLLAVAYDVFAAWALEDKNDASARTLGCLGRLSDQAGKLSCIAALEKLDDDNALHWMTKLAEDDGACASAVVDALKGSPHPNAPHSLLRIARAHADRPGTISLVLDALEEMKEANSSSVSYAMMNNVADLLQSLAYTKNLVPMLGRERSDDYAALKTLFNTIDDKQVVRGGNRLRRIFEENAAEAERTVSLNQASPKPGL